MNEQEAKEAIEEKVFEDTGFKVSLKNSWVNPDFMVEALRPESTFVKVDASNFYLGEDQEVLNPGMVFIEGRRDLHLTARPFQALQRDWTPEGKFFHHR